MNEPLNGRHESGRSRPSRVVVLDYYDGPIEGLIEFDHGSYWFDMPDRDEQLAQGGTRLFELTRVPADAIDQVVSALTPYDQPVWPVWCPKWSALTDSEDIAVADAIDGVRAGSACLPAWTLTSSNPSLSECQLSRIPEGLEPAGTAPCAARP